MSKKRYALTLESLPNRGDETVRLRKFLKMALRCYGLKCIRCEELKPEEATK